MAKHLTLEQRILINEGLKRNDSFKQIARNLDKHCTSISKEIRNHIIFKNTGATGKAFNSCIHRKGCDYRLLCDGCKKTRFCWSCKSCNKVCPDFQEEICKRLSKPPYVCNGCADKRNARSRNVFMILFMHKVSIGKLCLRHEQVSLFQKNKSDI